MKQLEKITKLYSKGLSARTVGKELGLSADQVYKIMQRNNLPRRRAAITNKEIFLKKLPSFKLTEVSSQQLIVLKAFGVALYWAEGTKGGTTVEFSNSDERMVGLFVKFLREVCGINETKLRVRLYCFPQHDVNELIDFWANVAHIPRKQFIKPFIRKDANGKRGLKLKYGLVQIRYHDKKLLLQLNEWVSGYCANLDSGGVPKRPTGPDCKSGAL